jgi:hypothetical protein
VSSDDKLKPAVEENQPDPEKIFKKLVWDYLVQKLGWVVASVAFVTVFSAWSFHAEITEVVSDLYTQIVKWWPLPKAKPDVFTVAIARLEGDDEKNDMESTVAQDLRDLQRSNGIAVLEFHRTINADSDDEVQTGQAKAQKWLTQSGAQVLIWGKVLTVGGNSVPTPLLYWTSNVARSGAAPESKRYDPAQVQQLPTVFQTDLSDILRLLVVTQSAAFNGEQGHFCG